jgi:hypothetical protein
MTPDQEWQQAVTLSIQVAGALAQMPLDRLISLGHRAQITMPLRRPSEYDESTELELYCLKAARDFVTTIIQTLTCADCGNPPMSRGTGQDGARCGTCHGPVVVEPIPEPPTPIVSKKRKGSKRRSK